MSAANHNYSEQKLQQVILYFLEHINNVHLGRTKLMKLLYFVDFGRRRRLSPQDFLDYAMPLPSRDTQTTPRKVRADVDALKRLQAETAAELDALLPAIFDRSAFKGDL